MRNAWISAQICSAPTREGFVEGTAGALTDREIAMLPDGAYIITLEQAIRFPTDYLEGDAYYHTAYADHNLVRTRTRSGC